VYTVGIGILVIYVLAMFVVPYLYPFSRTITIRGKSIYGAGRNMNPIITDTTGAVYTVNNNWLVGDFDAVTRYGGFEEGKTYRVSGYGVRVALPFIQLFPNITQASPA
jgi:hypothetical protein